MWGFQFLLILHLWGISFHAVFGLDKDFLFKSTQGHCEGWLFMTHSKSLPSQHLLKGRIWKSTIKLAPEWRLEKPTFNQKITFVVFCILQELSLSFLHLMLLSLLRNGFYFLSRVEETFNKDYFFIWY